MPPRDDIPDFELIRRMADNAVAFEQARDAWGYFYVRHRMFLLRVCNADHGQSFDLDGQRDLVDEAFMKAFDGAVTFDHREPCEPGVQQRKCRAWLAQILQNLVFDRFRDQKDVPTVDVDDFENLEIANDESAHDEISENERLCLLRAAFESLSDTEQTILRATMAWWNPTAKHQRMPNEAMQSLSKLVEKSPAAIRQIRSRAVRKLTEFVNGNYQ